MIRVSLYWQVAIRAGAVCVPGAVMGMGTSATVI